MEPIISPWVFYAIHLSDSLFCVFVLLTVICVGLWIYCNIRTGEIYSVDDVYRKVDDLDWNLCYWKNHGFKINTTELKTYNNKIPSKVYNNLINQIQDIESKYKESFTKDLNEIEATIKTTAAGLENWKNRTKNLVGRGWLVLSVFFFILSMLIPDQNCLYKMIFASQITSNNIQVVKDSTKNSIDYVFEKIQQVVEKERHK